VTEVMLVCIVYGENGFALAHRAIALAGESSARLHLLIFDPRSDDYDGDRLLELPVFEEMAAGVGGTVRHVRAPSDQLVACVRDNARAVGATQVVIGQRHDGALLRALGWSTVEEIMRAVPDADLHIVPVARARDPEWPYEPAVPATLVTGTAGMFLRFGDSVSGTHGLFVRERETDFDNGVFLHERDGQVAEVSIMRGRADRETP
jgi:two-component system sensor histidine kinase KdpD